MQDSESDPKMTSYVVSGNQGLVSYTLPGGLIHWGSELLTVFELSYNPMSCRQCKVSSGEAWSILPVSQGANRMPLKVQRVDMLLSILDSTIGMRYFDSTELMS